MANRLLQLLREPARRNRVGYVLAMLAVMVTGMMSRRVPGIFPAAFGKYPGDVLWALMVFLGWGIIFPRHPTIRIASYALVSCIGIEFFKLYESPTIDTIRNTTLGRLVFGYVFSWGNLIAYAAGIAIGASVEATIHRRKQSPPPVK